MTTPAFAAETERKLSQLDNDVLAIYGLLKTITKTQVDHGERLNALGSSLTTIAAVQKRQGNRLDGIDVTLAQMDSRLDGVDSRLDGVDSRLEGMDAKLETIIAMLGEPRSLGSGHG